MNELTAQDACTAVKAAILKLEAAIKASQKLGTFKAKHQVDMLLRPLQVGVNNQTSIQQGSFAAPCKMGFLFLPLHACRSWKTPSCLLASFQCTTQSSS
jgi:hypothetical protein